MKKRNRIFNLPNIIYFLLLIIIGLLFSVKKFDNDIFFDIKTGESILKYGIDFKDHFCFVPNLIYLYHHWLYDLFVYYINIFFGYLGLKLFFAFTYILFCFVYFYCCNKLINNRIISFLVTLITMYFGCSWFTTRVQSITYLLFFLEMIFLNRIYEKGDKKYILFLGLLSVLIVNIHMPLWIFTLIIFLPYLTSATLYYLFNDSKKKSFFKNIIPKDKPCNEKVLFLTMLVLVLTGLISPYGFRPYYFFSTAFEAKSYILLNISELTKTTLIGFKYQLALIVLFMCGLYLKILKINLRDFFMVLGLFVFSLIAIRNIIYFTLFTPYILLKSLDCKYEFNFENRFRKIYINKKIVQSVSIVFLLILLIYTIKTIDYPNNDYKINEMYPVEITKYIKENLDYKNIKLYNHFNYGSYLEYNDIPVFIDSRAEVYIKEFNGGYDLTKDYVDTLNIDKYQDIFKKYKFDYALVYKKTSSVFKRDSYFIEEISDDNFILYKIDDSLYDSK